MHPTLVEIKVFRKQSDNYIYVKSEYLHKFFTELSMSQLHVETPIVGDVAAITPKGKEDRVLYQFYKIKHLPETPYSLQANWDVLNNFGWLRAVGIDKGVDIPIPVPITKVMAVEIVDRVKAVMYHIWNYESQENENVVLQHIKIEGTRYA